MKFLQSLGFIAGLLCSTLLADPATSSDLATRQAPGVSTFWAYAPGPIPGRSAEQEKDMTFSAQVAWDKTTGNITLTLTVNGIDTKTNPITMIHLHPGSIYSESSPVAFFCGSIAPPCKQTIGGPVKYSVSLSGDGYPISQVDSWFKDSVDQMYVAVHTTLSYYPSPIRSQVFPAMNVYSDLTVTSGSQGTLANVKAYFPDDLTHSAWIWISFPNWQDDDTLNIVTMSTDGTSSTTSSTIVYCFCGCQNNPCPTVYANTRFLLGATPRAGLANSTLGSALSQASLGSSPPLSLYISSQKAGSGSVKASALQKVASVESTVTGDAGRTVAGATSLAMSLLIAAAIFAV